MNQKYSIFIQARASSSRSPGKVLHLINGKPMLLRQMERLRYFAPQLNLVCITSTDSSDDAIEKLCLDNNFNIFRGSLNDVLSRYIEASYRFNVDYIIRVGGDDPLIDGDGCLALLNHHKAYGGDFLLLSHRNGWPYGTASELLSLKALKHINSSNPSDIYREHIIPFFKENPKIFKSQKIDSPPHLYRPDYYFSVDYKEDIQLVSYIFNKLIEITGEYFTLNDVIKFCDENPSILEINRHLHDGFE